MPSHFVGDFRDYGFGRLRCTGSCLEPFGVERHLIELEVARRAFTNEPDDREVAVAEPGADVEESVRRDGPVVAAGPCGPFGSVDLLIEVVAAK